MVDVVDAVDVHWRARLGRIESDVRWWQRRMAPWAIAGAALVLAAPLAFYMKLAAPEPGDAVNCGGIGFGEEPCGWDAVTLTFVVFGVPYLVAGAGVLALLELLPGRRGQLVRVTAATLFLVAPWCFVTLVLLSG